MADRQQDQKDLTIPLHEEQVEVGKRRIEKRHRVSIRVHEREEIVRAILQREDMEFVRVPVDREVAEAPTARQTDEGWIIPLTEERLVIETRLFVREELHIRRCAKVQNVEQPIKLRREEAEVLEPSKPET